MSTARAVSAIDPDRGRSVVRRAPVELGDAELLALLVGRGSSPQALGVASGLLERFRGLDGLARATELELQQQPGVGPATAARVHAALALGRRALGSAVDPGAPVCTPAAAHALLGPALRHRPDEELHALYLDRRRRPIEARVLTRGTDGFTIVDPRQVYRYAVAHGASGVILAHNHPSGDPEPSAQDRDVTRRVAQAGRVLGIPLLDHLVIGSSGFTSLAEQGELPHWAPESAPWTA